MNRAIKVILIICAICFPLGVIFTVAGVVGGGADFINKGGSSLIKKVAEVAAGSIDYSNNKVKLSTFAQTAEEGTTVIPADNITDFDFESGKGEFKVVVYEGSDITIDLESDNKGKVKYEIVGNTLKISAKGTIYSDTKVTVYMPQNIIFDNVNINVGAGVFEISDILTAELDIEAGAGEIYINNITATKSAELEIGACDFTAQNTSLTNPCIEIGMSNFEYQGVFYDDVELSVGMGTANIELDNYEDDYNYDIEVGLGSANVGDQKYSGAVEREINNDATNYMEIEVGMGELTINLKNSF
ncbi:MAG: DUF4097 family beta strand repeat-containing protein [Eubacterium sp.]